MSVESWKMPPDFWTALEKGLHYYMGKARQNSKGCASPCTETFNTSRDVLQQAFREQEEILLSNLIQGRVITQWKVYTKKHLMAKFIKLRTHEWAPRLIIAMWDHTTRQ
jgi:hypothetical protein